MVLSALMILSEFKNPNIGIVKKVRERPKEELTMLSKEKVIEAMAKCLNEKEREILSARWGLENGITIRIEELKEIYGITIEQLRDIERKIILYIKET